MPRFKMIHNKENPNGVRVQFTPEEETARDIKEQTKKDNRPARKLKQIKELRLHKLKETDWYSNVDVTMPDDIKTWRQGLRDIPQNNTTEEQYDLILARDKDENSITCGHLTHAVWSKP